MRRATEASHFRCGEDGAGDLSSPAGSAGSCLDQDEIWVSSVQTRLMEWYREARRDLPWRANRDPYRILVSEMMLVQTTVTAVIPYFDRFLNQFPDAGALAAAAESDVLKAWEGLGYYRRARQLQAAAQTIVSEHGGAIPNDPALVRALPGVGRYIAGAILSFAFDRPEPIVEANSQRVLARLLAIRENLKAASTLDRLWRAAARLVPARSAGIFNQGLMELGALVCTPRASLSRLSSIYTLRGPATRAPRPFADRDSAAQAPGRHRSMCDRRQCGPHLDRPAARGGLWEQFWEFPTIHQNGVDPAGRSFGEPVDLAEGIKRLTGIVVRPSQPLKTIVYSVTKHRVTLTAHGAQVRAATPRPGPGLIDARWVEMAALGQYTFSSPSRRLIAWINREPDRWEQGDAIGRA